MQIGLIAQDVQTIFPEAVNAAKTDTIITLADGSKQTITSALGLQYDKLVAPLIAAMQELKALFDGLAARVERLVAEVTEYDAAIKSLQAANDDLERGNAALVKRIEALEEKFKAANDNQASPVRRAVLNRKE